MIYLTSFKKFHKLPSSVTIWSAAVYQPKGFTFPKVDWTDIRDDNGQWIRPRLFINDEQPLQSYRQHLLDLYENRVRTAARPREQVQPPALTRKGRSGPAS